MVSSSQKPPVKISNLNDSKISSPIASSQDLGWESLLVEKFKQLPGAGESGTYQENTICLCLSNQPNRIIQTLGDRTDVGIYTKGDITITLARVYSSYRSEGEDSYLQITITPDFLKLIATEAIETEPDRLELNPEFRTRNPQIEQLAMMLRKELHREDSGVGRLYIDSLANALTVNLLRDYAATKPQVAVYEGGLGARQLLQVIEYINEHLDRKIKLADLASAIGISQFHFSRLFKQSMGISPHQYLLQQRIDRAKQLLKNKDLSVIDIAFMCGFNSHSHLSKQFRQHTGLTPTAYRVN